jgi:addiction module HigA family antidote
VSIKNEGPAGWAVHPGEMLREEFLRPMGISAYRLSVELGVSAPTVNDIVREKRGITPEMAARLARYFGTSEQFWLNLQDAFAVHQVKKKYSRNSGPSSPLPPLQPDNLWLGASKYKGRLRSRPSNSS